MLPRDEADLLDELEPGEAAEELLARMLEARRYRRAAEHLAALLEDEHGHRFRAAPLPGFLRRVTYAASAGVYDPAQLGAASATCCARRRRSPDAPRDAARDASPSA